MKVRHAFSSMRPVIDHQPVAGGGNIKFPCDLASSEQEVAQKFPLLRLRLTNAGKRELGNHKHMNRGLGVDVVKCNAEIILMDD